MENNGVVTLVSCNEVTVKVIRQGSCGENCASCKSCTNKAVEVQAYCDIPVDIGDRVLLQSPTGMVVLALSLVFLLPIMLPILIYILIFDLIGKLSILVSVAAFLFCVILIYKLSRSERFAYKLKPKVISVYK